jgi:glycosyltransferase involved in cell wall biosynthesis
MAILPLPGIYAVFMVPRHPWPRGAAAATPLAEFGPMQDGTMVTRAPTQGPVIVVTRVYPDFEDPHVASILTGLVRFGHRPAVWTLKRGMASAFHRLHREAPASIIEIPRSLSGEPIRMARGVFGAAGGPGFMRSVGQWLGGLWRVPTPTRLRQLGQAAALVAENDPPPVFLLALDFDLAADVARLAATMMGVGWGCIASARSLHGLSGDECARRLAGVTVCYTETEAEADALRACVSHPEIIAVAPPAIDLSQHTPPPTSLIAHDGQSAETPVKLLAVSALHDPTHLGVLLRALSDMPKATHWHLTHIGDGPGIEALRALAKSLRLSRHITWEGRRDHDAVLAAMREADIFIHTPGEAVPLKGISRTMLVAASQRLPIVAERGAGGGGFLQNEENALLVRSGRSVSMAEAIDGLARDPSARHRLGAAGRAKVEAEHNLDKLLERLTTAMPVIHA